MLTGLEDVRGGGLARAAFGDDVAGLEGPAREGALDGGVPCAEAELCARVGVEVGEGVVEEAGAALDLCAGRDGELDEFDGIWESRR